MPAQSSVKLDTSGLQRIAGQLDPRAAQVIKIAAMETEDGAKQNAPVDTGALKASIYTKLSGLSAEIGASVEYAIYQELGTSKMAAHPFLIPSFELARKRLLEAWGQLVK